MGAKIGRNTVLYCQHGPICADMVSIGDNTVLRKDSIVLGYRAQSNFIHIGPVTIGSNAFVGEASVLDIDTQMGDDTQLGHASSLQSGQRVPDGKRYHGSPAVETTSNYCPIENREPGVLRKAFFSSVELAMLVFVAVPAMVLAWRFGDQFTAAFGLDAVFGASTLSLLATSAVGFFGAIVLGLAAVYAIPRLCMRFLTPGVTYPVYRLPSPDAARHLGRQQFSVLLHPVRRLLGDRELHALRRLDPEHREADRLEHGHQPAPRQSVPVQHRQRTRWCPTASR